MNIYWGDLHNHCGISYGYGSLENALKAAEEQLDFVSIIGHASWHDIPERDQDLEYLVDFHEKGFQKLEKQWDRVREMIRAANKPHDFITFQGYEAHSSKYGDHHILSIDDNLPLVKGDSPADIVNKIGKVIASKDVISVPHHVGYTPGYRGANWETFNPQTSPIVEVYSKHGCSVSDQSPYPYLHDMGPRDSRNTAYAGIKQGLKFGFAGSTDHHAGYPGSYGDGKIAVLAKEKTREAIWEAILARRTYAVTGDKIACTFQINNHDMGAEIFDAKERNVRLSIKACDTIDKIVVYKNLKPWQVVNGESLQQHSPQAPVKKYKIRIEMGWGNSEDGYDWNGKVHVKNGQIMSDETCFRGRSVLAPSPDINDSPDMNHLNNKVVSKTNEQYEWTCTTFKNPTTLHAHTAGVILEVAGDHQTRLDLEINNIKKSLSIGELIEENYTAHTKNHNSEAILVHRAVPENEYNTYHEWIDEKKEYDEDVYHVEIRQKNNQFAWISPIYVHA